MRSSGRDYVLLLDEHEKPGRWVAKDEVRQDDTPLEESGRPAVAIVESTANLYKTLDTMITSFKGSAIVVDKEGRYQGVVDFDTVLEATSAMHSSDQEQEGTAQEDLQTEDGGR